MLTIIGKGKDARNLAKELGCHRFSTKPNISIGIRYGNVRDGFNNLICVNTTEAINNARNKLRTL